MRDAWASGDSTKISEAVKEANRIIRRQSIYINLVADGASIQIQAAGFIATTGVKTPAIVLGKTQNVKLTHGAQAGSIIMAHDKLAGASVHATIVSTNPNLPIDTSGDYITITIGADKVIIDISGKRIRTYKCLTSTSRAYVKTIGYNSAGKGADSDMHDITVP